MSLAPYVRILGRGPGRARAFTRDEASAAMALMLKGADAEAVGAILMLLRMKGETAEEIAGFASAARQALPPLPKADLDWPSYAAGRTRGLPWFLLSARLVARAGFRVVLHGWNGPDGAVRAGLRSLQVAETACPDTMARALDRDGLAYAPLERLSPALFDLLRLRDVLGLRSCINTVCRMLNPTAARASVQGVFHPSYRLLQADAAQHLGWRGLSVIKGGGGEFERHPSKDVHAFGLRDGRAWEATYPALSDQVQRLSDETADPQALADIWAGSRAAPFAETIILGTAALALDTLGVAQPDRMAQDLWQNRHSVKAA
ncbi:MAG: glycosyl transferase family protein [Pseudomonadota bacterium]